MIGGSVIKGYISEHDEDKMKFECTSNEVILGTISKDEIDSITKFVISFLKKCVRGN